MSNTLKSTNIVSLQEAVVMRGQRAWSFIKKSPADQRQAWREVGEALAYGRAMHPSNQAFGKWLVECGFDDVKRDTRADAMWLAQNWSVIVLDDNEITHPSRIRLSHSESIKDTPPAPELTLTAPDRLTASIEQVGPQAKTINKLARMADRGIGQEKVTAQRYLDKKAKGFGMETEELVSLSKKLDPTLDLPISSLDTLEKNLKVAIEITNEFAAFIKSSQRGLGSTPLTREMAIYLVIESLNAAGI